MKELNNEKAVFYKKEIQYEKHIDFFNYPQ